jgi:hypothetical protein
MKFEMLTERIGRLTVAESFSPFGIKYCGWKDDWGHCGAAVVELGMHDDPLYRIHITHADDEWVLETLPGGRFFSGTEDLSSEDSLFDLIASSSVTHGYGILSQLPPGDYYLVRTPLRPINESQIQLGNSLIPSTPNMRVLRSASAELPPNSNLWPNIVYSGPNRNEALLASRNNYLMKYALGGKSRDFQLYAFVVGSDPEKPPDLTQPLIGLVCAGYTGTRVEEKWADEIGVAFFTFSAPQPAPSAPAEDPLLVIPVNGEMVLAPCALTFSEKQAPYSVPWEHAIPKFVKLLAEL